MGFTAEQLQIGVAQAPGGRKIEVAPVGGEQGGTQAVEVDRLGDENTGTGQGHVASGVVQAVVVLHPAEPYSGGQ